MSGSIATSPSSDGHATDEAIPVRERFSAELVVRGQSEARRLVEDIAPTHILSILTPGRANLGPKGFSEDRHLVVSFADVDSAKDMDAPNEDLVHRCLAFARAIPAEGRLLVHGLQGVRRAPAMGLGLLADRLSPAEAAQALSPACSQPADPQPLLITLFDKVLGLDGRLVAAADARFVPGRNTLRRRVMAGE